MSNSLLHALLEIGAPRIVYVSCNPATLARDIAKLSPKYQADVLQPVDLFPRTEHVECIAVLRHTD
jgi:23S rRNA (uracil1939-C5)-methyltransferase